MKRLSLGIQRKSEGVELNMSPLIDMVFILLIFFLVTTSFVKEATVTVKRPSAASSSVSSAENTNMFISVSKDGYIFINNELVDITSIRSDLERWFVNNPVGTVIIMADNNSRWGASISVLDKVRAVGIKKVVVTSASSY